MIRYLSRITATLLIAAGSLAVTSCGKKNDTAPAVVTTTPEKTAPAPVVENKPAAPVTEAESPSTVVASLYREHDKGAILGGTDRKILDKHFDSTLATLIWKDQTETPVGEIGHIEFDPFYDAQDSEIKDFKVGEPTITGEMAKVRVTFQNFKEKVAIDYDLRRTPDGWRVSNVHYGKGDDMVTYMSRP